MRFPFGIEKRSLVHTLYLLSGNSMQHLINILEWGAIRIFADLLYEAIRRLINIGLIHGGWMMG